MSILKKTETQIFLGLLFVYWALIIWVDNTNINTCNGLYKSVQVYGWETFTKFTVDSGGLLYAISMAAISKLIPDSFVSFYGDVVLGGVTYRKLAFINSLFGAGASAVLYHLAFQVTRSRAWSVGVTVVHAFSAFILINSIISEDIMPAYFFYLLSFLFVFKSIFDDKKRLWLTLAAFSTLAVMFLHWSLFPIAALTYLVVSVYICREDRQFVWLIFEQVLLFLSVVFLFCQFANYFKGYHGFTLRFFDVLLPGKVSSSWVGFEWSKFEAMFIGIGNYLFGGKNEIFLSRVHPIRTLASWSVFLFIVGGLWNKKDLILGKFDRSLLLIFGVCSFVFGQLVNLYGQPQDPQFQLQPMVLIPFGLICLYQGAFRKYFNFLYLLVAILAVDNVQRLNAYKHLDSKMVAGYKEFRQTFPKDQVRLVHQGYEDLTAWLMLFEYKGDWTSYLKDITCMGMILNAHPQIPSKDYAGLIMEEINEALKKGKKVVSTTPWVNAHYMDALICQNLSLSEISNSRNILLSKYKVKQTYKLKWGEFAEIVPND